LKEKGSQSKASDEKEAFVFQNKKQNYEKKKGLKLRWKKVFSISKIRYTLKRKRVSIRSL
jgi:hypothetical protein